MKRVFLILAVITVLAVAFAGCTSQEEEVVIVENNPEWTDIPVTETATDVIQTGLIPDRTQAPDNGTGIDRWKADGVIEEGEYENHAVGFRDLFDLYWTSDDEYLYMGMKGKTMGWLSVGFNPSVGMGDADIILGGVKGTSGIQDYIYDMYSIGTYGPHPSDTELGGSFDIIDYDSNEGAAFTTIEFSRKLDTGDKYDSVLKKGESAKVLWSLSYSDVVDLKHNAGKGSLEITI